MKTSAVSFGRVVAVSGKDTKMKKIDEKLQSKKNNGSLVIRDVTQYYKYAPLDGVLSKAAQKGDRIEIYITGNDIQKLGNEPEWKTLDGILTHVSSYYDAAKFSIRETMEKIIKG